MLGQVLCSVYIIMGPILDISKYQQLVTNKLVIVEYE